MALVLQYHIISSLRLFTLYRFPWHYKYFLLLIDYILTSEIHYSPSPEIEYPNLTTNSVADQLHQLHRHFCPIARIRLISSSMYIKWASVVGSCTKEPSVSHPYHLSNLANIILEQGCTTMKPVSLTWQGHWNQNSQQLWFSIEKKIKPSWHSGMNSEVPPQTEKYWLLVVANEFRDRFLAISLPW